MTAIICFLDKSDGRDRITAIGDSRASREVKSAGATKRVVITDDLAKMFRVRLACHELGSLDLQVGAFKDPYYSAELGLCFSGYCLEAMTIVAQFTRCVERLVDAGETGQRPVPDADRLMVLLRDLCTSFFRTHKFPVEQDLELVLFGYSIDGAPWAGKVTHHASTGAVYELAWLDDGSAVVAGDCPNLQRESSRYAQRIKKRLTQVGRWPFGEARERETAMCHRSKRKYLEEKLKKEIKKVAQPSVGGRIHKTELYYANGTASLSFTEDAAENSLLADLFGNYEGLRYLSVKQNTGENDLLQITRQS